MRKLRVWNGRGYDCRKRDDPRWEKLGFGDAPHANICAYSRADARRVVGEYSGDDMSDAEIKEYWAECWGNSMNGIKRERGLWLEFNSNEPPIKVI